MLSADDIVKYIICLWFSFAIHKTHTVLPLEAVLIMTKALLLHKTLHHEMTVIKEAHDLIALVIDHTNHLKDMTLYIDHAHIDHL